MNLTKLGESSKLEQRDIIQLFFPALYHLARTVISKVSGNTHLSGSGGKIQGGTNVKVGVVRRRGRYQKQEELFKQYLSQEYFI